MKPNCTKKIKQCLMCPKLLDDSFYDKGLYTGRILCSKSCRDKFYASRKVNEDIGSDYDKYNLKCKDNGLFYKQGHLVLANYNVSIDL